MTGPEEEELRARNRWLVLNAIRIGGLVLVLIALAIHAGRIPLPVEIAYLLAALGLVEFFVLPNLLARKWRGPDA